MGALPLLPRFGGGALDAATAIPAMLGAGASDDAGAACKVGAVPPLTTIGAVDLAEAVLDGADLSDPVLSELDLSEVDLSGAAVLPAADGAEAEGLVEAGAAASEESSSLFGLVDVPALGCEPGKAAESGGAVAGAVDAGGMLLAAAGLGATGAGFVAVESGTGWLVVDLYCVQP